MGVDKSFFGMALQPLLPLRRTRIPSWQDDIVDSPRIADLAVAEGSLACRTASDLDQLSATLTVCTRSDFWPVALLSLVLGVLSVAPYGLLLGADPGCPLFISFMLHVLVVVSNLGQAGKLIRNRKIPAKYHAAIVLLGFTFNALKCDAFTRLPTSVCMLLLNLRMLVAAVVQFVLFGERCSSSQLAGVAVVTGGVAWAGRSVQGKEHPGNDGLRELLFGTAEVLGAMLALSLLSVVVKQAFSRYGESVDEQMFVQHLFSLPLFFIGGQWSKIGPRLIDWFREGDMWLLFLLTTNVLLTVRGRAATVRMAGRAPNLLLVQLVQTVEKSLQLFTTALLRAPPFPPAGFWGGSSVLALGTLHFLRATQQRSEREKAAAKC